MYSQVHMKTGKWIGYTILMLSLPLLAYGYIQATDSIPQLFPPCGMKTFLHIYCPGCGGTRAMGHLIHFHFIESFLSNPLVIFMTGIILYYWGKALYMLIKYKGDAHYSICIGFLWAFLAIMIIFFVVRNILLVRFGVDYLGELAKYYQKITI